MLSLVNLKRRVNSQLPWKRQFIFRQVNYKTPVVYWLEFLVFILSRVITNYKNATEIDFMDVHPIQQYLIFYVIYNFKTKRLKKIIGGERRCQLICQT